MATVKNPLQSEAAIGSVGGVTYGVHKQTNVARSRSTPANPQSARQLAIRAIQTTVSRAWAGLDAGERTSWDDYAAAHPVTDKFGLPQTLSGFNWFCGFTAILLDMGFAQVDSAPSTPAPGAVAGLNGTGGAGQISVAFTAHGGTATQIDIWGIGPHSAGRAVKLANAVHKAYGPGETTPLVVSGLAAGLWTIWARFADEATGQVGPWATDTATVT